MNEAAKTAARQFTSDVPKDPGWYWWRKTAEHDPEIRFVDWYAGLTPPDYSGLAYWSIFRQLADHVEEAGGEWLRADPPGEGES